MKIISLEASNVKRLKAVRIEPDGSLVVIGGKNGAGKSSVLDAIAYALGGRSLCPSKPIRDGEAAAVSRVDLGELVVERTWTDKGSYLHVKTADGMVPQSPQAVLDKLVGRLSFDPLAFTAMAPREQVEALRELVGLDFAELDAEREQIYRDRTNNGRDVKRLEGQLASMPEDPDAPEKLVSVSDLMVSLEAAEKHNAREAVLVREREAHVNHCANLTAAIDDLELRLRSAREELTRTKEAWTAALAATDGFQRMDTDALKHQIADADNSNTRHRQAVARRTVADQLADSQDAYRRATAAIEGLDTQKRDALAGAEFPVPGLSFDEERVLLNGIPFDQASSAEQLRVSVAMGLAANPKLRVVLIRDGSLLDADNLALVAQMAEEADAQVWIEVVSSDGEGVSVMIEDGEVVGGAESQPELLEVSA